MSVGELNKGAVMLIVVLLLGAAGFLWYSQLYSPAVAEQQAAKTASEAAQAALSAAQQELAAANQRIEESKKEAGKVDDSVSRLALARKAIPTDALIDDAAIVLMDLANTASIRTSFSGGDSEDAGAGIDATAGGSLQGATPIDLEFTAAGTYREMMYFMSLVEGTIEAKGGKLYARDRLFNVVKLELGASDEDQAASSGGFGEAASEDDPAALVAGPGEMIFTVTVRMYSSSTENAQGVGDAAAAQADAAAAASGDAGAGGAPADPNAAAPGTDPNATAGADPNATGGAVDTSGTATNTPAPAAAGAPA
jgi:hypothetical protein